MKKIIGVLAIAALAWFIGSPYVTAYQMKSAADARDDEALSAHIDYPAVRQSFKDQLNGTMSKEIIGQAGDNPLGAIGAAFGGMVIDGMVDAFVTPAGVAKMMKGQSPKAAARPDSSGKAPSESAAEEPAFDDAKLTYNAWDKFSITMLNDSREVSQFILRRRGIGWKLTEIIIPTDR